MVHWNASVIEQNLIQKSLFFFFSNGHLLFTDIDECELGIAQCPEHSVCVNLPGTYFCNCTEGFQQLGLPAERCAGQL